VRKCLSAQNFTAALVSTDLAICFREKIITLEEK